MRQLLTIALALTLFTPFTSLAQTNNCISYYTLSASTPSYNPVYVTPPTGCTGPIQTPITAKSGGNCVWGDWAGHQVPASAASPAWFPDQKRSSLWFWEKTPTPANYADNWGTCDLALQWTDSNNAPGYYCNRTDPVKPYCDQWTSTSQGQSIPYMQCMTSCQPSRNWVDININPEANKYSTGQIIKFTPDSNILSTLTKFNWDFSDGISRTNEPNREEPVVYTTPGKKIITLSVLDPKTNKTIATSTEIKIRCVPPSGSVPSDELSTIFSYINSYKTVNISNDNFLTWSKLNQQILDSMFYKKGSELITTGDLPAYNNPVYNSKTISYLMNYSSVNNPVPILFGKGDYSNSGNTRYVFKYSYKTVIVVDFRSIDKDLYQIKYIDPKLSKVITSRCWDNKSRDLLLGSPLTIGVYCPDNNLDGYTFAVDPSLLFGGWFSSFSNQLTDKGFYIDHLVQNKVQGRNVSRWLIQNLPSLNVFYSETNLNFRASQVWSDFVIKMAYLADFVGECANIPTAEIPSNNSVASVGLLDFFNLLFKDLFSPIVK